MKILSDYHHADLFESLAMTLVDRFGWELYRPIGMEWLTEGFWQHEYRDWFTDGVKVRDKDDIPRQYLALWDDDLDCGDHWERADPTHPGRTFKMVMLEQARSQGWDVVLSTLVENEAGLCRFAHETGAHYGIQIGNQWADNQWGIAEFGLCSTTLPFTPHKPHVFYRQEFNLSDFRFEYPPPSDLIGSWVQALPDDSAEYQRFRRLAGMAPELDIRYYGHSLHRDELWVANNLTTAQVAETMRAARAALHFKTWSDGYGHVIHNLFAVGKPVLATASYYSDKLAGPLFIDGETSFDVQTRSDAEAVEILRRLVTDDDFHRRISENAARRFTEIVDFDADAEKVRGLLENVASDRLVAA